LAQLFQGERLLFLVPGGALSEALSGECYGKTSANQQRNQYQCRPNKLGNCGDFTDYRDVHTSLIVQKFG